MYVRENYHYTKITVWLHVIFINTAHERVSDRSISEFEVLMRALP